MKHLLVKILLIAGIFSAMYVFSAAEELAIAQLKPAGFIYEDVREITVTFSKDMAALNDLNKDVLSPPVRIEPPVEAKYQWITTKQLRIIPTGKLDINRKYRVIVPKGTVSYDKKFMLSKDYANIFVNNAFRVIGQSILKDSIILKFNYPVLSSTVYGNVFIMDNKDQIVKSKCYINKSSPNEIIVKSQKTLMPQLNYSLHANMSVMSDYGNMGLASNYEYTWKTGKLFMALGSGGSKLPADDIIYIRLSNCPSLDHESGKGRWNEGYGYTYLYTPDEKGMKIIENGKAVSQDKYGVWFRRTNLSDGSYDMIFDYSFKPNTDYRISINENLHDGEGRSLEEPYEYSFRATDFIPKFKIKTGDILLESYMSGRIPMWAVNRDNVKVSAVEILSTGTGAKRKKTVSISTKKNVYQMLPFEFRKFVEEKSGTYELVFGEPDSPEYSMTVNLTRTGLLAKVSYDKLFVFAYDLKTGEPQSGAVIKVPMLKMSGRTDKDGICIFDGDFKRRDLNGFNSNFKIFYEKGQDRCMLQTKNRDNMYVSGYFPRMWTDRGSEYEERYYRQMRDKTLVYTDRGLYKPGEIVNIKGIRRIFEHDKWNTCAGDTVIMKIENSRGEEIFKKTLKINKYGTFIAECSLAVNSPTGAYSINVSTKDEYRRDYFRVEEFKPAEFSIDIYSDRQHVYFGEKPVVNISGRYMYGSPMSGDTVKWKAYLNRTYYTPKGYEGYNFANYNSYGMEAVSEGKSQLDESGGIRLESPIEPKNAYSGTYLLTYLATVKSASGMELTKEFNMYYHPVKMFVGLKIDKWLYESGEKPLAKIAVIDPEGKKLSKKGLKLTIVNTKYMSAKKVTTSGRTYWENLTVNDTVEVKNVDVSNGEAFIFIEKRLKTGRYTATLSFEQDSRIINASDYFYVCGDDEGYWWTSNDSYVEMMPDKKSGEYELGESAKIMIQSPYRNLKALITVEREKIYKQFITDIKSNAKTISIPIDDIYAPNVYVSAFLFKGRTEAGIVDDTVDLGKPYFGVGFTNLKVSYQHMKQNVEIKTEKTQYRPGETVNAEITVTGKGKTERCEVSVAVVDLGILSLIGYENPDPLTFFYSNVIHEVSSFTNAGDILGERNYGEKGENRGGDGGMTQFRTEFLPIVYYEGQLETDANGKAKISFKLPDNLTTFRINVVSCTTDRFGSGYLDFTVNKPFMLNKSLPNFTRDDDSFTAGIVAENMTDSSRTAEITCSAEGAELTGDSKVLIELSANSRKEVLFKFRSDITADTLYLKFRGVCGPNTDDVIYKIPVVRKPVVFVGAMLSSTEDSLTEHPLGFKGSEKGTVSIDLSSTIFGDIKKATEYLFEYPYGCLEQRTSRALPLIVGETVINTFDIGELKGENLKQIIMDYLKMLGSYQQADGGFSIWPGKGETNPYLTVYVVFAMQEAEANGYKLDDTVYKRAEKYVWSIANKTDTSPYYGYYSSDAKLNTRAFAVYLLKRGGYNINGYLKHFEGIVEQLGPEALAWMLVSSKGSSGYESLYSRIMERIKNIALYDGMSAHFEQESEGSEFTYYGWTKPTSALTFALLEAEGKNMFSADRFMNWLLRERTGGRWKSTQENAFAILAIDRYFNVFEKNPADFNATVKIDRNEILSAFFKGYETKTISGSVNMKDLYKAEKLEIQKKGKGRLYYNITVAAEINEQMPPINRGFTVAKVIKPVNDGVNGFVRGELYEVTVTVKNDRDMIMVAVDDPIPSGFEIINKKLNLNKTNKNNYDYWDYDGYYRWFGGFNHKEIYFDRYVVFADYLEKGEHTFKYIMKASYQGDYFLPQTKAEEMYMPDVFGTNSAQWIEVR